MATVLRLLTGRIVRAAVEAQLLDGEVLVQQLDGDGALTDRRRNAFD